MRQLSIHGADQVLLPPEPGLPYLRHHRASAMTLGPGALCAAAGRIAALEPDPRAEVQVDAGGGAVVPGFVDCHTHLPFAGWAGDVAASEGAVLRQSRELAAEMLRDGTTAFECRGTTLHALRLAARLGGTVPQSTVSTAEVAPTDLPEAVAETRARAFAAGEDDVRETGRLAAAHDLWLRVTAQADVGAALALGARSLHGLTELGRRDVGEIAAADCAAVLLPAAELLTADHVAPGRALADAGAICAIATGCHPSRAPVASMPLVIGLAARLHAFSATEALLACTLNAAWVLGLSERAGSLEPGKRADVLVLDGPVEHLPHRLGRNPVAVVVCAGEVAWVRPDQAWRVTST